MANILNKRGYDNKDKYYKLMDDIVIYPTSIFSGCNAPGSYTMHWHQVSWKESPEIGQLYNFCKKKSLMAFYEIIEEITKKIRN